MGRRAEKHKKKGSGSCTRCGRIHPKGKKKRKKLGFSGCNINQKVAESTPTKLSKSKGRSKHKNARSKERNLIRKEVKRKQHNERLNKWRALSLEDKVKELSKRPGKCQKQLSKLATI